MIRIALIAILVTVLPAFAAEQAETLGGAERADTAYITARGTGQTTGHIATLTVENQGSEALSVVGQTVYIPSDGRHQSYVGRIPGGTVVPPGATAEVPVEGYCADVYAPPVPDGEAMPPLESWLPVGPPSSPDAGLTDAVPVALVSSTPLAAFDPTDLAAISAAIEPGGPSDGTDLGATVPGTDMPLAGTIDPEAHPEVFAPLILAAIEQIEAAVDTVQSNPDFATPISADPEKERESIIQQAIWIFTAIITGDPYEKEDFANNVYEQYEASTGVPAAEIPDEDKEQLESGVNDFWNAFVATGVEAKVLRQPAPGSATIVGDQATPVQESPAAGASAEGEEGECVCKTISFDLSRLALGLETKIGSGSATEFTSAKNRSVKMDEIELDAEHFAKFELKIHNVKVECDCSTGGVCPFYPDDDAKADARNTAEIKLEADGAKISDESTSKGETSFTVTPGKKSANTYVRFRISAHCVADRCKEAKCQRWFSVNIKPKKEEEEKKD